MGMLNRKPHQHLQYKGSKLLSLDVAEAAKSMVIKSSDGWVFITQEGKVVGPETSRDIAETKAALYLTSIKED